MEARDREQLVGKKRRRKSSGKLRKAAKEAIRQSTASLLAQASSSDPPPDELPPVSGLGCQQSSPHPKPLNSKNALPTRSPSPPLDPTARFAKHHKPHKPSADVTSGKGRKHTISVAIPGSIVENAQTWELKTALVGQIARACAIYSVDEIIIFDETAPKGESCASRNVPAHLQKNKFREPSRALDRAVQEQPAFQPSHFVARILEHLECPQYLRKSLFPLHPDLRLAGLLPPLDLPHHLRREHASAWREGCVLPHEQVENLLSGTQLGKKNPKEKSGGDPSLIWVDVGLEVPIQVSLDNGISVPERTRVTVQMPRGLGKCGRLVSPRAPAASSGLYWGYSVRLASSISKVFSESPFLTTGGYDLTIGTSERGQCIDVALETMRKHFDHLLLVLGGLSGLELCIASDSSLDPQLSAEDAPLLFDYWLNTLPHQGSRTIRTEEALLVSLGALRRLLLRG